MRTVKLIIAYDGTGYAGWQLQPGKPTIQQALEEALHRLTGESIRATASGRTDAGVHAQGQVISFETESQLPTEVFVRGLNAELPDDIVVRSAAEMPSGFHATRDARRKRYRYTIHDGPVRDVFCRPYAWHVRARLDEVAMHQAAQALLGTHDFRSFETRWPNRTTSVRTIFEIAVRRGGAGEGGTEDLVTVEVEADGFLYNMVRAITGTLVEVGRGVHDKQWPATVLAAMDRQAAGPTAPALGLCLVSVTYD